MCCKTDSTTTTTTTTTTTATTTTTTAQPEQAALRCGQVVYNTVDNDDNDDKIKFPGTFY